MLDTKTFGEKLRNHRKKLGLSQENVAEKIGVTAQAVSKWENGECLPDCFNLKSLGETYGVSLDILLETETTRDADAAAAKIEQLADEFIWATESERDAGHKDLGENLLKLWKGIYFIESGNREMARRDKELGNMRVMSDFGLKIWDDDGVGGRGADGSAGQTECGREGTGTSRQAGKSGGCPAHHRTGSLPSDAEGCDP